MDILKKCSEFDRDKIAMEQGHLSFLPGAGKHRGHRGRNEGPQGPHAGVE